MRLTALRKGVWPMTCCDAAIWWQCAGKRFTSGDGSMNSSCRRKLPQVRAHLHAVQNRNESIMTRHAVTPWCCKQKRSNTASNPNWLL